MALVGSLAGKSITPKVIHGSNMIKRLLLVSSLQKTKTSKKLSKEEHRKLLGHEHNGHQDALSSLNLLISSQMGNSLPAEPRSAEGASGACRPSPLQQSHPRLSGGQRQRVLIMAHPQSFSGYLRRANNRSGRYCSETGSSSSLNDSSVAPGCNDLCKPRPCTCCRGLLCTVMYAGRVTLSEAYYWLTNPVHGTPAVFSAFCSFH